MQASAPCPLGLETDADQCESHLQPAPQVLINAERIHPVCIEQTILNANSNSSSGIHSAFLATAQIRIHQQGQLSDNVKVLCDPGAQIDIISSTCARRLGLRFDKTSIIAEGVNGKFQSTGVAAVGVCARNKSVVLVSSQLHIIPNLRMTLPSQRMLKTSNGLELADPSYNIPSRVELILAAGTCAALLIESTKPARQPCGSIALCTRLGWILFGPNQQQDTMYVQTTSAVEAASSNSSLDVLLQRFWECEDLQATRHETADEKLCEEHFRRTHYRDSDGRFVVKLPIKENSNLLGSSFEIARKRFLQLERRLQADEKVRAKYIMFMRELLHLGHMRKCTKPPLENALVYHIPHHCVLKKFRVVFDASCKSITGLSLNDIQHAGARLQDDLVKIILRFRTFPVAITADIVKMFRQVKVDATDWDMQRVFWRETPQDPLLEYWITVVIYGETSSSFNAVRAMQQAGQDNSAKYPIAANAIANHFYMDDLLTGAENAIAARALCKELTASLRSGGFELDKWASNARNELQLNGQDEVDLSSDDSSVLGLLWNTQTDVLRFKFQQMIPPTNITKRTVVSAIAKLFDPIGLLAPIIVRGKSLIQDLWRIRIDWDEPMPADFVQRWIEYNDSLSIIEQITVPRWLNTRNGSEIQLHGFADASSIAYGATIYIRVIAPNGEPSCFLLGCKTRIAPVKTITIPRLELCAAELLARYMLYVRSVLTSLANIQVTFWTDSEVVLFWIKKLPCTLKTFVANRVSSIQEATAGSNWRHVASRDNPADIASRGSSAVELKDCRLWWEGPHWLSKPEMYWPPIKSFISLVSEQQALEASTPVTAVVARIEFLRVCNEDMLHRFSTLQAILRITSYIRRFAFNTRVGQAERRNGVPSPQERDEALTFWISCSQQEHFRVEIRACKRGECIPNISKIKTLTPFVGSGDILRVGGRLQNSLLPYDAQHPIILPGRCRLAELLVREAHFRTLHGGAQMCIQYLRQRFWLINMRQVVKSCINRCTTCVRHRQYTAQQLMGNLPDCRTQPSRAFKNSGVDYAGPITIKARTGRSHSTAKGYIALFVCLVTRAVHLEAVSDLTVGAFMAAFHRFVSRRGQCALLMSDNSTTFVGADNAMRRISHLWDGQLLAQTLAETGTEWRFITPAAPHQGGIWEAGIKSVKHHLRRVMGCQIFTFETLATVLARIEACLNSRPLMALSDDHSDLTALTPAHFLIGEPLVQPLSRDLSEVPENRLKLWCLVQKMTQDFWNRWNEEYLLTMQCRRKWFRAKPNLEIGDLVLISNENQPPAMWAMGRIISVSVGQDGLTRSCRVRTATTQLDRPVQKLCLLPVRSEIDGQS